MTKHLTRRNYITARRTCKGENPMKKYNLSNYDFLNDTEFQLYLSETLIAKYGSTSNIPKQKWWKAFSKCCKEWIAKLNKPRTTSDL